MNYRGKDSQYDRQDLRDDRKRDRSERRDPRDYDRNDQLKGGRERERVHERRDYEKRRDYDSRRNYDYGSGRRARMDEFGRVIDERREREREEERSRDRSPMARKDPSPKVQSNPSPNRSPKPRADTGSPTKKFQEEEEMIDDPEQEMMRLMGFGGFDSTKGKHLADKDVGVVDAPARKRGYKQVMNRVRLDKL